MSIGNRRLTYDDFSQLPSDGKRYEIIDGELFVAPVSTPAHQQISGRLCDVLYAPVVELRRGKIYIALIDVKLSEHDIVEPDVMFISNERRSIVGEKYIDGSPDLIVEILSPESRYHDEVRKARLYAGASIREYWIVDPTQKTVRVLMLTAGGYQVDTN